MTSSPMMNSWMGVLSRCRGTSTCRFNNLLRAELLIAEREGGAGGKRATGAAVH